MKYLARITAVAVVALLLAALGLPGAGAEGNGNGNGNGNGHASPPPKVKAGYEISVVNLTENQILTPPVFALHNARANVFDLGRPASVGVQEIAENGNLAPLVEALEDARGVRRSGIGAGDEGPLPPGAERTFTVDIRRRAPLLSTVQMLVCTNDGFTGLDSLQLPTEGSVEAYLFAFDAGTEINTDDVNDFVPPCSAGESGTGVSNPALAEGGVVAPHPGLIGDAAAMWGFDPLAPVAKITVTRVG